MLTGDGVTRYISRGILTTFEVGDLNDARTLAAAYETAPTGHHLLGVHLWEDLAFAALAGEDERAAAGVAQRLQRHVVHRAGGACDGPGQQHVQPKIARRRQYGSSGLSGSVPPE